MNGQTKQITHDDAGNLTTDEQGYVYDYDYENRLTSVKKTNDTVEVAAYAYDALGRRVEKYDAVADETIHYYYDGWRVLAEYDDSDTHLRDYVYGNYLDEVLVKTEDSEDIYYAHDHLFSPVALFNEEGTVIERYEYDAYGKRYVFDGNFNLRTDTLYNNFIAFTGQRLDTLDEGDLLIMYYKNRYYLVVLGRFLQRDPKQHIDSMNLYEYVKSSPCMNLDPKGTNMWYGTPLEPFGSPFYPKPGPKCGTCGPDITASLTRMESELVSEFKNKDDRIKESTCAGRVSSGGWDIRELKKIPHLKKKGYIAANCASGDCTDTVWIHGRCQSPHEVNYYLYGVMTRLCAEFYTKEIEKARIPYLNYIADPAGSPPVLPHQQDPETQDFNVSVYTWIWAWKARNRRDCKIAWYNAGKKGDPSSVTCGNLHWCKKCGDETLKTTYFLSGME